MFRSMGYVKVCYYVIKCNNCVYWMLMFVMKWQGFFCVSFGFVGLVVIVFVEQLNV